MTFHVAHRPSAGMACVLILAIAIAFPALALAQATHPASPGVSTSLTPLKNGWEQIDQRLVFLTVRLSSDEASLEAINKAIKLTGYQQGVKSSDADGFRHSNEIMDRKGGGPKPWDEFYGRTAEKFFYHPVDPNTIYINPQPIPQRPPQMDYIYRANTDDQKRAEDEAAALSGKIDKLLERRRQLEAEQDALWCEIAFQAIASRDFALKPVYRFDLTTTDADPAAAERLDAVKAGCDFVRVVNRLMSDSQRVVEANPDQVFGQFPAAVSTARSALVDRLVQQASLTADLGDPASRIGKVAACAKQLDDLATNIADSYRVAQDGDKAGDDQREERFRGLLQDNLLSCAEMLLTMDQCVRDLTTDWKINPDLKTPAVGRTARLSGPQAIGTQGQAGDAQAAAPRQGKPIFDDSPASEAKPVNSESNPLSGSRPNEPEASQSLVKESPNFGGGPAAGPVNRATDLVRITAAPDWVEMLPTVDLSKHHYSGKWRWNGQDLVSGTSHAASVIELPLVPAASYEIKLEFTRLSGSGELAVLAPVGAHRCTIHVTGASHRWAGLELVGSYVGSDTNPTRIVSTSSNDEKYLCEISVTSQGNQASISMSIDGKRYIQWSGAADLLATNDVASADAATTNAIGLDAWEPFAIDSVAIRTQLGKSVLPEQMGKTPGVYPTFPPTAGTAVGTAADGAGVKPSPSPAAGSPADDSVLTGDQANALVILSPTLKPYVLEGDYEVPAGTRLEIQAGTTIDCKSRSGITVKGVLVCSGTKDHPVVFCGDQHSPGWWKGIMLRGAKGSGFSDTQFFDSENGIQIFSCKPRFDRCIFANNRMGLSIGELTGYSGIGQSAATLENCVLAFNSQDGIHVHGGDVTLRSTTITKNGGWGVNGAYYVKMNINSSIVSLNDQGGIVLSNYESTLNAEKSVLSGNKHLDLVNNTPPTWDLRGNFWGPTLTAYLAAGGQTPPNFKGNVRFEEFLPEMPKDCGSSIRDIGGQPVW